MANKIKRTIPWFIVLSLIISVIVVGFNLGIENSPEQVSADTATTSVVVGNAAPSFSSIVENPSSADGDGEGSTAGNPTNEGDLITWKGTATDPNGDDWYLAICKENSIATNTSAAPTCGGSGAWVITGTTTSATEQTATTSTTGVSATSSDWYAFACDHSADQECTSASQGTGTAAENSPFNVNHRPTFTDVSNNGPKDPGTDVTWSSTSSDSDKFTSDDWIGLYICKEENFATGTTPGCGGSGEWCSATSTSNPSCNYSVPTPTQDKSYNAYAYIVDNHGLDSSDVTQGFVNQSYC